MKGMGGNIVYQVFIHCALVILAAEVIYLTQVNQEMESNQSAIEQLAIGDELDVGQLETLNGDPMHEVPGSKLVFVFSSTCEFCELNRSIWKDMAYLFQQDGTFSVFGISLDNVQRTRGFVEGYIECDIFVAPSPASFMSLNKIPSIPQTILLSDTWEVERIWSGSLSDEAIADVMAIVSSQ
ncbi:MAG: hypothetical protein OEV30_10575 [Ignavibacteria bacterium]|nr:hypothetical protein [Ignavibacteria bacterium]